jgi:hypothetical protein
MTTIGTSSIQKIENQAQMAEFLLSIGLDLDKPVIIKPNWVAPILGEYTDTKPLELLLSCIRGPKYIVESYTFWRTDLYQQEGKDYFSSKEGTLETGKQHWDHFQRMDEWFLKWANISPILEKYQVKYINITNEFWAGRCVPGDKIKALVEKNYSPVACPEFYSFIPKELFDLKGAQFLSFAHAKAYVIWQATLSVKNLFGLIPAPTRYPLYHGPKNTDLPRNVVDINKIYRTLFNCFFAVEGISTLIKKYHPDNNHEVIKDWGYIIGGKNSVEVDNIAAKLIRVNLKKARLNPIDSAEEIFGGFDREILKKLPKEAYIEK